MTSTQGRRRYDSGLAGPLPSREDLEPRAHLARVELAMDEFPLGQSGPCMNPECDAPVDFLPGSPLVLYCSTTCRARAAKMRARASQQLAVIEDLLADTRGMWGIPRERLHQRAAHLRWWVARLAPSDDHRR